MKRKKKRAVKPPSKILLDLASYKKLDLAVVDLVQNVDRLHFLVSDLTPEITRFKSENDRRSSTAYKAHETRRKNAKKEVATSANSDGSYLSEVSENDTLPLDLDSANGEMVAGEGFPDQDE